MVRTGSIDANPRQEHRRISKVWWIVAVFAIAIAAYAALYVVLGPRMYPDQLSESFLARPWGIYPHAFFGMLALALGPFQFRNSLLQRRPEWHRRIGTVYVCAALLTGLSGVYMSLFSFGGITTHLGFGVLGLVLFVSTAIAYRLVRRKQWAAHREWMIRSFSLLFAAVTLRLLLPLLQIAMGEFEPAYVLVSWLCWVPNLVAAELYVRSTRTRNPLWFLQRSGSAV